MTKDDINKMVMEKFPLKSGGRNSGKIIDIMKRKAYYDGIIDTLKEVKNNLKCPICNGKTQQVCKDCTDKLCTPLTKW